MFSATVLCPATRYERQENKHSKDRERHPRDGNVSEFKNATHGAIPRRIARNECADRQYLQEMLVERDRSAEYREREHIIRYL